MTDTLAAAELRCQPRELAGWYQRNCDPCRLWTRVSDDADDIGLHMADHFEQRYSPGAIAAACRAYQRELRDIIAERRIQTADRMGADA